MLIVQRSKPVGNILDQIIYAVEKTKLLPLFDPDLPVFYTHRNDEQRYIQLLNCFNLGRDCLFSHSYDLTSSLQSNCIKQQAWRSGKPLPPHAEFGDYLDSLGISSQFCWNARHMQPIATEVKKWQKLFVPLVVGFFASYSKSFNLECNLLSRILGSRSFNYFMSSRETVATVRRDAIQEKRY